MAILPTAIDPARMGLNITPYDNDNTAAAGTTTLRHIDNSARLAWSTFGSVQSDPYRWGRATLPGYTPPADRRRRRAAPNAGEDPLDSADSPQTIAQSARNGVPISGREPGSGRARDHDQRRRTWRRATLQLNLTAAGPGTRARVPLRRQPDRRQQELHARVEHELRARLTNPAPDYGLSACAPRTARRRRGRRT